MSKLLILLCLQLIQLAPQPFVAYVYASVTAAGLALVGAVSGCFYADIL